MRNSMATPDKSPTELRFAAFIQPIVWRAHTWALIATPCAFGSFGVELHRACKHSHGKLLGCSLVIGEQVIIAAVLNGEFRRSRVPPGNVAIFIDHLPLVRLNWCINESYARGLVRIRIDKTHIRHVAGADLVGRYPFYMSLVVLVLVLSVRKPSTVGFLVDVVDDE